MIRMVKLYEVQLATGGVKFVLGWRCPVIDWRGIEIKQLPVTWYSYGAHLFPPISMWIKQFLFKASCFYSGDLGLLSEIVERSKWTCVLFLSIASSSSSFSSDRQCSSFHHLMYYRTGAWCVKPSMYQCRLMWCVKPSMYQCRLIDWFFISSIYMKISQIHQHIKNKVSVIYDSSMFCNSLLKELVELETTTDDGKLFQRWMISGKNENW
jgi:hypothetical protein